MKVTSLMHIDSQYVVNPSMCAKERKNGHKACSYARTTDAPNEAYFHQNPKLLGRQFGHWVIFGRFISTHFGTVSPLSIFSSNQPKQAFTLKTQISIWD